MYHNLKKNTENGFKIRHLHMSDGLQIDPKNGFLTNILEMNFRIIYTLEENIIKMYMYNSITR